VTPIQVSGLGGAMRRSGCHLNPTLDLDMERCVDSSVRNRFCANVHQSGVSPFRLAVASAFARPRSRGWRGGRDGPLLLSPSGGHTAAATDSCQDRWCRSIDHITRTR